MSITITTTIATLLQNKLLTPVEFFSEDRHETDMSEYLGATTTGVDLTDLSEGVKAEKVSDTATQDKMVEIMLALAKTPVSTFEGVPVIVQSHVINAAEDAGLTIAKIRKNMDVSAQRAGVIIEIRRGAAGPRGNTLREINEAMTVLADLIVTAEDGTKSAERAEVEKLLTEKGYKLNRIRAVLETLESQNVKLVKAARPAGPRASTVEAQNLALEFLNEIIKTDDTGKRSIERSAAEKLLTELDINSNRVRAALAHLESQGVEIIKGKPGRPVDAHRLNVTRQALAAANAAGVSSKAGRVNAVRRFWEANQIDAKRDENGQYVEAVVYRVILEIQGEMKPAQTAETSQESTFEPAPM